MTNKQREELIALAFESREKAYAPYSDFLVGAALLCENGEMYGGCNIENASYGACNCAERTAIFKAVSEGHRKFEAIAIVGKHARAEQFDYCAPCGICRQVMAEFCDPKTFQVILPRSSEDFRIYILQELLPLSFTSDSMTGK